jgi:hypothetical protein
MIQKGEKTYVNQHLVPWMGSQGLSLREVLKTRNTGDFEISEKFFERYLF